MDEQRAAPRKRTLLRGRIEFNNRQSSLDCLIRDLSETGARLTISENVALPRRFDLHIPNRDHAVPVELCWRIRDAAGVRFSSEQESSCPQAIPADVAARLQDLE